MPLVAQPETAAERAIGLRMRPDLKVRPQRFGRTRYWAVKDPISLKYFHLREEEYTVLSLLDGRTSMDALRRRCEQAFAPRTFTNEQLHGFLATLHRYGLLLAETTGQGEQLLLRHDDQRRQKRYESLLSALAIRFRGVNPRLLLDWLDPLGRRLFSRAVASVVVLLAIAAVVLVTVEFEAFRARLPDARAIVAAENLPWLFLTLAVTKILHELGHALACRRFGGECHEIGVMLLIFTPCLYCNVSDSWMLPNKWHRIAISAAGMYVELLVAAVCTFLWWFSQPGLFNSICLNVVIICSVATIVFNGNPLLRYDGYFILSDLVDVPNLKAQSVEAVKRVVGRWCLGLDIAADPTSSARRQALLILYAAASSIYRLVVVITVLWNLTELARPYGLEVLVVPLAALTVVGMAWPATVGAVRWFRNPAGRRRVAPARALVSGILLAAAVLLVALMPLPMRVAAPVVVEYRDAQRVYVTVPGTLVKSMHTGETAKEGQTLAQLASPSVQLEVAKLTSERDGQRLYLANLESQRLQGVIDGAKIPAAKAALVDVEERLGQYQRDAARLTIVAPVGGTVLPPPNVPRKPRAADMLDRWWVVPLDPRNLGSYLDTGTLVCLVGDPSRFEAALHVEQTDIELVAPGQRVRIMLDSLPGEMFWGTVAEIAKLDLKVMPRELQAAGDLPSRTDQRGVSHPLDTWYQARVLFDEDPAHLVARVHGRAKISVTPQSLFAQVARYVKQTFSR